MKIRKAGVIENERNNGEVINGVIIIENNERKEKKKRWRIEIMSSERK